VKDLWYIRSSIYKYDIPITSIKFMVSLSAAVDITVLRNHVCKQCKIAGMLGTLAADVAHGCLYIIRIIMLVISHSEQHPCVASSNI
jgi:hypothetical protein